MPLGLLDSSRVQSRPGHFFQGTSRQIRRNVGWLMSVIAGVSFRIFFMLDFLFGPIQNWIRNFQNNCEQNRI